MAFDDDDGNTNVCLHLLLGSPSCTPSCCCDESEKQIAKNHKRKYQETKKQKTCKVDDQWEIKKVLETSDICKHKTRLLLNKDLAEKFVVPVLLDGAAADFGKGGVQVQVWDIDTKSPHSVVFKYWPSAKSYVFTKTWTKEFVNRRELKKDDQIALRWDRNNQRFDFSVLKKP
ncbi:putative B3 domain-containing protein At1g78640 [Medicago truncatula]|uniref:E1 protein n=1 Tax=Medicago truncatula TaxID=3880 RepID=A0A072VHD5_MEDTR|nr:putative B3 domain-containing protein At1g78640 [Medicago truncatula]KEH41227.1 E1 protein [Medicago truncatula]